MFGMSDKEKPDLKLVSKEPDLTIKQRAFVNEIVKGKLGSLCEGLRCHANQGGQDTEMGRSRSKQANSEP